jgi:hypothetical protein
MRTVRRFDRQRSRTLLAVVLVVIALGAVTVVGISAAQTSSSAAQYQYGKVTICHHTHSKTNPTVTIVVSRNALPAHLRHGDTVGPCDGAAARGEKKQKKASGKRGAPPKSQGDKPGNGAGKGKGHGK